LTEFDDRFWPKAAVQFGQQSLSRISMKPEMLSIREMTTTDIPDVFAVRVSTVENNVTMRELEEEYELTPDSLADAIQLSSKGWVCEVEGKIVGFAMGDSDNGELTVIAVLGEFERRGIGETLLATVRDWLFQSGHNEIWLVTTPDPNFRAYGFYLSQGWTATEEIIEEEEKFVLRNT
jgi:ribosomal protein S18 acetylase RimI-like enzyme